MTPNPETLRIITAWCASLADITAHLPPPNGDGKPSKSALAAYASVLGQALPSGAFTMQSLAFVAGGREWFPAVGVAQSLLREWWNDNKPHCAVRLTDEREKPHGWEPMDEAWLRFWGRRQPEIRDDPKALANLASLIRQQSPRAWSLISGDGLSRPADKSPVAQAAVSAKVAGLMAALANSRAETPAKRALRDVSLRAAALEATRKGATP